jgi:hypothetical protein
MLFKRITITLRKKASQALVGEQDIFITHLHDHQFIYKKRVLFRMKLKGFCVDFYKHE